MNRLLFAFILLAGMTWGCSYLSRSASASRPYPLIVAFGDSLTAGLGVDSDQNDPSKLQARIDAHGYHYEAIYAGISGETTQQALNRVDSICALRPKIVIVEFGANDGFRGVPVRTTRRNLATIVSRLQAAEATVILAGMKLPADYGVKYSASFRNVFAEVAEQKHTCMIPFFLEGVGGHPDLNQSDGLHPTAKGYDVVVENVRRVLQPLLINGEMRNPQGDQTMLRVGHCQFRITLPD